MKNYFLLLLLLLALYSNASVSAPQEPNIINYKGTQYNLHNTPLTKYFINNPEKFPTRNDGETNMDTGLWRGYIAEYEIINNSLYIIDIKMLVSEEYTEEGKETIKINNRYFITVYDRVFPNTEKKIVDWYTGILVLAHGEIVEYSPIDFGGKFENYILIETNKGTIHKTKKLSLQELEEFKNEQFKVFKKNKKYHTILDRLKSIENEKSINSFILNNILKETDTFLVD